MFTSRDDCPSPTAALDSQYTLPKVSLQDGRSAMSSPVSASEQTEMQNTAKLGRLSRRTTFAPAEGLVDSAMQPLLLGLPSVAKLPSIPKQSSFLKQSSVGTQLSMGKQSSIPNQSSMHKQPSIASQGRSISQTSTSRGSSADLSQPLSTKKSVETGKIPARRSSSILQSRKSLQSMKTAKIDDMLNDYKVSVERKAKPAEVNAGQHALQLDAAMQKLTLDWIVQSIVSSSHDTFSAMLLLKHSLIYVCGHLMHIVQSLPSRAWVQCSPLCCIAAWKAATTMHIQLCHVPLACMWLNS